MVVGLHSATNSKETKHRSNVLRNFRTLSWLTLALATAFSSIASAQGAIPKAVIEECSAAGNASKLPDCLKKGAVAYEMLEIARSKAYYGTSAAPVIEICSAQNETIASTWTCFQIAAEKAVETRKLIGLENITDICVSDISDPDTYTKLYDLYQVKRKARFPDSLFFVGGLYQPFRSCPEQQGKTESGPAQTSDNLKLQSAKSSAFDANACAAYGELEQVIASNSADDLKVLKNELKALEQKSAPESEFADTLGVSRKSGTYLLSGDESKGMTTVALLGVFLKAHHPGLLDEFLDNPDVATTGPAIEGGNAVARAIMFSLIEKAGERYRVSCDAS